VSVKEFNILESAGQDDGIATKLFTSKNDLEVILEYVVEGNSVQMNDKAFIKELKAWIRFNASVAMKHGDETWRWALCRLFRKPNSTELVRGYYV
jgi:hypothetical protein